MDDDWRLQVDLEDRVIASREGERIFLYAGTREPLEWVRGAVEKLRAEVETEYSLDELWRERPPNPLFFLGGLAG
ncbi:MAG TPA: hypothetical protein VHE08_05655 [Solirubrobacterales bacterium]|nr:hypothetical protein [Solirubrobacterales bacterium]